MKAVWITVIIASLVIVGVVLVAHSKIKKSQLAVAETGESDINETIGGTSLPTPTEPTR